jgi:hypothetical protein
MTKMPAFFYPYVFISKALNLPLELFEKNSLSNLSVGLVRFGSSHACKLPSIFAVAFRFSNIRFLDYFFNANFWF